MTKEERWALMAISDTFINTSLRHGYTIYPLEYIVVKGLLNLPGNMIISTFAGSLASLVSSTLVNPYSAK